MSCLAASPRRHHALDPQHSDDDLIAYTLIRIRALTTGRALRRDVPIDQLSEEELIEFWADSLTAGEQTVTP
jgi:hypothetical protein